MTEGEFFAAVTGHESDLVRAVTALRAAGQPFCLIGGLAVNNYSEPVVTLDADFAVVASIRLPAALEDQGFEPPNAPKTGRISSLCAKRIRIW